MEQPYLRKGFPLTHTPNTQNIPEFPTEWEKVNFKNPVVLENCDDFEYRQLSDDTYEIRSRTNVIMVNKEGYTLFTDNDNSKAWNEWLRVNTKSVKRKDL